MNRRKLTLKDYPENKDVRLDKRLNNKKAKKKKALHLDSAQKFFLAQVYIKTTHIYLVGCNLQNGA